MKAGQDHETFLKTGPLGRQKAYTVLFEEKIDQKLSRLDNALIMWEVARCIQLWPLEDQVKALASEIGPDPRNLNLGDVCSQRIHEPFDERLAHLISQFKYDASGHSGANSPIDQVIRTGRTRFTIALDMDSEKLIRHKLVPATATTSNYLIRTYGADCFLQISLGNLLMFDIHSRVSSKGPSKYVWKFLNRPIMFACRMYKAAVVKDSTVWFFSSPQRCERPITVIKMLEKEIPLHMNLDMKMSKYTARLQLSLSTTSPTITFSPHEIHRVPDVYSNSLKISKKLMIEICKRLQLHYLPSAIEGAPSDGCPHTWALFEPESLPDGMLIEVWHVDEMGHNTNAVLTFEFWAIVYEPCFETWKERRCTLTVPGSQARVLTRTTYNDGVMTDGAAAISLGAALQVRNVLGLGNLPTVYQARILKSKGLWYLSPSGTQEEKWIEIRHSQWKAQVTCSPNEQISFNLCQVSKRPKRGHVNRQSLPVMVSRQVPRSIFTDLMRKQFREVLDALTTTHRTELMMNLEAIGHLSTTKRERVSTTADVCLAGDEEHLGFEKYSQRPLDPVEEAVELLKSAFHPRHARLLERLVLVGRTALCNMMDFKLTVPLSVSVYAMPDPTGTLQEGEVFLQLSHFRHPDTHLWIPQVIGDCLVSRSPCVHPCDVQKVQARVNCSLVRYEDVLVCSVLGHRSLLDRLSGGDYDGDTVTVIWDPQIVEAFVNADPVRDHVPTELYDELFADNNSGLTGTGSRNFKKPLSKVKDLYDLKQKHGGFERELLRFQLSAIFEKVNYAHYAQLYKVCEYILGVSHELTKKFGYVYTKCLDAPKRGICLRSEAQERLQREFWNTLGFQTPPGVIPLPPWTKKIDFTREQEFPGKPFFKPIYLQHNKNHILEHLCAVMDEESSSFTQKLESLPVLSQDSSLTSPWMELRGESCHSLEPHKLVEFITKVVQESHMWYKRELSLSESNADKLDLHNAWETFWVKGNYAEALAYSSQDPYSLYTLEGKGECGYNLLKASAAASLMSNDDFFAFHMAFKQVCHLKTQVEDQKYFKKVGVVSMAHSSVSESPEFHQALLVAKPLVLFTSQKYSF